VLFFDQSASVSWVHIANLKRNIFIRALTFGKGLVVRLNDEVSGEGGPIKDILLERL